MGLTNSFQRSNHVTSLTPTPWVQMSETLEWLVSIRNCLSILRVTRLIKNCKLALTV